MEQNSSMNEIHVKQGEFPDINSVRSRYYGR